MGESNKAAGDTHEMTMLDKTQLNGSLTKQPQQLSRSSLKRHLLKTYGLRPLDLVNRYFRSMFDVAVYASNAAFLMRCEAMRIVPREYRVDCRDIKYTHHVARILDECSFRLMLADLDYNQLRKLQKSRVLERLREKLEKVMSTEDLSSVVLMAEAKYETIFETTRDKQRGIFTDLLKEYDIDKNEENEKEE
ncbi:uncharacterized protein LOC144160737 [Haemaphysalis longicornis]